MTIHTGANTYKLAASQENLYSGFRPGPTQKQAVQSQKMARGLKFRNWEEEGLSYL